ncbi:41716_t:CDS:2, partial [Gigaspora margarita]
SGIIVFGGALPVKELNEELSARSKWKIDQEYLCIRSLAYEVYTYQIKQICAKCILLTRDHFIPKLYFKNNSLLKFLGNLDIKELWFSVFHTKDNNSMLFWLKLAKKGSSRAFESKPAFKELCEIMIQIAQCKDYSKGIQNLKHSEDFIHFTAALSSLSPKAYEFFRTNLAEQML